MPARRRELQIRNGQRERKIMKSIPAKPAANLLPNVATSGWTDTGPAFIDLTCRAQQPCRTGRGGRGQ